MLICSIQKRCWLPALCKAIGLLFTAPENKRKPIHWKIFLMVILNDNPFRSWVFVPWNPIKFLLFIEQTIKMLAGTNRNCWKWLVLNKSLKNSSFQMEFFTVESFLLFVYSMVTMGDNNQNWSNYVNHDAQLKCQNTITRFPLCSSKICEKEFKE